MRISIGILARNERDRIGRCIESICRQDLVRGSADALASVELVCVPNGCTDDTAAVAERALAAAPVGVACRVCIVERAGKANAWNRFVHELSDPLAELLILVDGDVCLTEPHVLSHLARALKESSNAWVSVPQLADSWGTGPRLGFIHRWRGAVSINRLGDPNAPHRVPGCLYCARSHVLRRFWLPDGMVGEDSFLTALVLTDLFRSREVVRGRVVQSPGAIVAHDGVRNPRLVWLNRRREYVTGGVNSILYTYLWAKVGPDADAGVILTRNQNLDPRWFRRLLDQDLTQMRRWVIPRGVIQPYISRFGRMPLWRLLLASPLVLMIILFEWTAFLSANRRLRSQSFDSVWTDKAAKLTP